MRAIEKVACSLGFTLLFGTTSFADVDEWVLAKVRRADQTVDNVAPSGPFDYRVFAELQLEPPSQSSTLSQVLLSGPANSMPLSRYGLTWEQAEEFPTEAAMEAAYPPGTYTLIAESPFVTFRESIELPPSAYPEQPRLTGSTLSDLLGMDPTQSVDLTWNLPTSDEWFLHIDRIDREFETEVFSAASDRGNHSPTTTGLTIPHDTLRPHTTYRLRMVYADSFPDSRDSFLTGEGTFAPGFGSSTTVEFTTAPEPTGWAWLLPVFIAAMGCRKHLDLCHSS